mmetsp:Transcript_45319/g.115079  ORF Transcript_45319/g.115079 Transcript_45319/m.115079 type:complete len:187 (-) Transcript_45319:107-667(-)
MARGSAPAGWEAAAAQAPRTPSAVCDDSACQVDIFPNIDFICLVAGAIPWYKELAGGLPIAPHGRVGPAVVRAAGCALLAGNLWLRMTSLDCFVEKKTPVAHHQAARVMITDGPFEYSRNPTYVSMVGALGAFGLIMNSWWGVASAAPLFAYLHLHVIPAEEAYMRNRVPEFAEYMQAAPRWLGPL